MPDVPNILDFPNAQPLKTGQTTDFTPAGRTTKDDGGFQKGASGSKTDAQYIVLTTDQYSGTTNITVNGKTDVHTNEAVQDRITGLMWNRTQSADVFGTGAQALLWEDATNAEDIFNYCDQANLAGLSGFSDWRVPNVSELFSLLDYITGAVKPNIVAFPTYTGDTWSSTSDPSGTTAYKLFSLFSNSIFSTVKTARLKTMLVRG